MRQTIMNNMHFRICRCGCNQKITTLVKFLKPPKIIERIIKCGYCGDPVDQNNTSYRTGKWFHDQCVSDYKNFYASLTKDSIEQRSKIVLAFRDVILFSMIELKDLRILHRDWASISKEKSIPLMMKKMAGKKNTISLNRNFIYHYQYGDP